MLNRFSSLNPRPLAGALCLTASVLFQTACSPEEPAEDFTDVSVHTLHSQLLNNFGLRPLAQEPVPYPVGSAIIDEDAAIRLGKAFFWDIQSGSDGQVACATCHHKDGADARTLNTMNPGLDGIFASGGVTGPGQQYTITTITNDDIIGSQGVARANFIEFSPDPTVAAETCTPVVDPIYGTNRRVEFRQAPSIFGAAFFRELFWAGEAHHQFNGITIWGPNANNLRPCPPEVACRSVENGALISQAVGPIANSTEMRCNGRLLNGPTGVAGKMLARQPL